MRVLSFILPILITTLILSFLAATPLDAFGELFHSSFEDTASDLSNGSVGIVGSDSAWTDGGFRGGTDILEGNYTSDVLIGEYICRLEKHSGSDSLYANAIFENDYDTLHVGMWFQLKDWEIYDVPIGERISIFELWDKSKTTMAAKVSIEGDRGRMLRVEFKTDQGDPIVLGDDDVVPLIDEPDTVGALGGGGKSVYLDTERWYYVEIIYKAHATEGGIELRLDGSARLYDYSHDTSDRKAGALLLGGKSYPSDAQMTLLYDDVDIDIGQEEWTEPPDKHKIIHPIHPEKITLSVYASNDSVRSLSSDFTDNFKRPFLQMVSEPEDSIFDLYDAASKYAAMGVEGVRFVWIGRNVHYGNPFVTGKPDNFSYDFTHVDSLVKAVTDEIGALMRIGLGRTPLVMQCLEGFEYDSNDALGDVWDTSEDSVTIELSDSSDAYERGRALKAVVTGGTNKIWRSTASTPDSNWAVVGFKEFDFRGRASKTNTSGTFFVESHDDTAYWDFTFQVTSPGLYLYKSFDLMDPDTNTTGWDPSKFADVTSFGIQDLNRSVYPVNVWFDWMRLPHTNWFPYDASIWNIRYDWWENDFCLPLMDHLGDNFVTKGFIFEGWNEVDRLYRAGIDTTEVFIKDIYKHTAAAFDSFEVLQGNKQLLSSNAFTSSKDTTLIKSFLQFVEDSSITMDMFGTHSYAGAPSKVVEVARQTRDLLDSEGFDTTPIYITAYMDYFNQDFRKDTNHRAAQWLMTMLKLEEANRKDTLNVAAVATYGYKDFSTEEKWGGSWPYNDNRRFYGAFGLLTNIQNMGGLYKAIGNAYRMVNAMHTYQLPVKETSSGSDRQYWVRAIATRKDTTNVANDVLSVLLVNFDNSLYVEEPVLVTIEDIPFDTNTVTIKQYQIDQTTSSLCFDGGWGDTLGTTNPVEFQDTTGTKFWVQDVVEDLIFVDAENDSFDITGNDFNTIKLTGAVQPSPGIYHILNPGGQSLALVDSTSATVVNGSLDVDVIMPVNSLILLRIKD